MTPIRWLGTLLLFLAMFEACARIDDTWTEGAPLFGRYDQSVLLTTDEFGITGRPGAHFSRWRMDSAGFRGPELRPGAESILCIGASETFGIYEPSGEEYPRQLENNLNLQAGATRYQVVNAGLPGQSLRSFARRAAKVSHDVRPSFAVLYPSLAIYIDPPPENFLVDGGFRPSPFQLRIGAKLLTLLTEQTSPSIQTALTRVSIHLRIPEGSVLSRIPESNVDRFRRDLSRLLDLLRNESVRVLLVTHATRFGSVVRPEDAPFLTTWRSLHPRLREEGFLDMENRLNQVIRTASVERRLPLVDAARWLYGPENFAEFVHFTPRGAAALAGAIGAEIRRLDKGVPVEDPH